MTSGAAIDDDSSIPVSSDAPVSLSPIRAIIAAKAKNAEIIIFTALFQLVRAHMKYKPTGKNKNNRKIVSTVYLPFFFGEGLLLSSATPHFVQNFAVGSLTVWHAGQFFDITLPHVTQYLAQSLLRV